MLAYLATNFERQAEMRKVRSQLESFGIRVTSRWLDVTNGAFANNWENAAEEALKDQTDVAAASVVIVFCNGELGRGGKDVELGMAIVYRKVIWLVGTPTNVFQKGGAIARHFDTTDELYQFLKTTPPHLLYRTGWFI